MLLVRRRLGYAAHRKGEVELAVLLLAPQCRPEDPRPLRRIAGGHVDRVGELVLGPLLQVLAGGGNPAEADMGELRWRRFHVHRAIALRQTQVIGAVYGGRADVERRQAPLPACARCLLEEGERGLRHVELDHHPRAVMPQLDLLDLLDPEVHAADRRQWRAADIGQLVAVEFPYLLGQCQPAQFAHPLVRALHRFLHDLACGIDRVRSRLRLALRERGVQACLHLGDAIFARDIAAGIDREVALDGLLRLGVQLVALGGLRILLGLALGDHLHFLDLLGPRKPLVLAQLGFAGKDVLDMGDLAGVVADQRLARDDQVSPADGRYDRRRGPCLRLALGSRKVAAKALLERADLRTDQVGLVQQDAHVQSVDQVVEIEQLAIGDLRDGLLEQLCLPLGEPLLDRADHRLVDGHGARRQMPAAFARRRGRRAGAPGCGGVRRLGRRAILLAQHGGLDHHALDRLQVAYGPPQLGMPRL